MKKIVFVGEYAFYKDDFDEIFDFQKEPCNMEKMSEKEKVGLQLRWAFISYLGGIKPSTRLGDALFGIIDPLYGMYRVMQRKEREGQIVAASEDSRIIIEDLYSKHPRVVRGYLEGVAERLERKKKGQEISCLRKRCSHS